MTLFLFTQGEKDTMEEFGRNFRSLWEMVEAFGGSPGVHKGLVNELLSNTTRVKDVRKPTDPEIAKTEDDSCKAVKAALLVSGANKRQYGKLKDELANNYLLGSDQYPDTYEKAMRILGNYQVGKTVKHALQSQPQRHRSSIHPARRPRRPRTGWTRKGVLGLYNILDGKVQ
jgi:hypothetical protein